MATDLDYTRSEFLDAVAWGQGYTPEDIAAGIGLSAQHVRNLLKGRVPCNDDATRRIARFLSLLPERIVSLPVDPPEEVNANG